MAASTSHAPLFHRVFLGHLLLLLAAFITGVILLDYLFVEGLALYLQRTPLILIPTMLALIGVAGLLALWSSGSAAIPVDRITGLLDADVSPDTLIAELARARTEENAALLGALYGYLIRRDESGRAKTLLLVLDRHLNIVATDANSAARLGRTPAELRNRNLRDLLAGKSALPAQLLLLGDDEAGEPEGTFTLQIAAAGGRGINAELQLLPLPGERWLLHGTRR